MSKEERAHGDRMLTIGQIQILYDMVNIMMDRIKKLEIIIKEDEKQNAKEEK